MKIKPPLVFSAADADRLVETVDAILGEAASADRGLPPDVPDRLRRCAAAPASRRVVDGSQRPIVLVRVGSRRRRPGISGTAALIRRRSLLSGASHRRHGDSSRPADTVDHSVRAGIVAGESAASRPSPSPPSSPRGWSSARPVALPAIAADRGRGDAAVRVRRRDARHRPRRNPTVIAFAPGGRVFVAEKRGIIKTWPTVAAFNQNAAPTHDDRHPARRHELLGSRAPRARGRPRLPGEPVPLPPLHV